MTVILFTARHQLLWVLKCVSFVVEENVVVEVVDIEMATSVPLVLDTVTSADVEEPKASVEVEETMTLHKDVSS